MSRSHLRLRDDTTWPHPERVAEVEWQLRHGKPSDADLLVAATACAAYIALASRPPFAKKLPMIREAMRGERTSAQNTDLQGLDPHTL